MTCVVETNGRKALRLTRLSGVSYGLPRFVYGATALPLILEGLVPLECDLVPVCTGLFSVCFL